MVLFPSKRKTKVRQYEFKGHGKWILNSNFVEVSDMSEKRLLKDFVILWLLCLKIAIAKIVQFSLYLDCMFNKS